MRQVYLTSRPENHFASELTCRRFAQYWKNHLFLCVHVFFVFVFFLRRLVRGWSFALLWKEWRLCFSRLLPSTAFLLFHFEDDVLVVVLLNLFYLPFFFFFRAGLFLLLNCCLAYFLRCGIMKCTSACCCFKGPPVFCCRVRRSGRDPSFPFQESWNALVFTFFVISSAWLFLTVNDTLHNWDALRERGT